MKKNFHQLIRNVIIKKVKYNLIFLRKKFDFYSSVLEEGKGASVEDKSKREENVIPENINNIKK